MINQHGVSELITKLHSSWDVKNGENDLIECQCNNKNMNMLLKQIYGAKKRIDFS